MAENLRSVAEHKHEIIEQKLDALKSGDRSQLQSTDQAIREHIQKEDQFLFPAAQQASGTDNLVNQARQQHQQMQDLLSQLQQGQDQAAKQLHDLFREHMRLIDEQLIPKLKQECDQQTLDQIARELGEPTHR